MTLRYAMSLAYDVSYIDTLVNTFDSFHPRLKFTEIEGTS